MGANIPPSGIYARHAGQHKVPTEVWARVDDGGALAWKRAEFVWASVGFEQWELLWARSAGSPFSVSVAYTPTQVTVSWVHANPKVAEQYRILRADGSLVGIVSSTATSIVDPDPRPLNGSYEVRGVVGGVPADSGTLSPPIDLRLIPTGLAGSWNGSAVELSWSHAIAAPDNYRVYVNGSLVQTIPGTSTSYNHPGAPRGADNEYKVVAVLSGIEAAAGATVNVATPALPPGNVTLTATTNPYSNLRTTWTHPGGSRTGYEVERYQYGVGPWINVGTFPASTTQYDLATTVAHYTRVRTLSNGGPSDWVQVGPVTPQNDVDPPANATITSFRPEASYGRMVLRFTTPNDVDFAQYLVQHRFGTGGWSNLTGWTNAARNTAYAVVGNTISQGQDYRVRVLVRDNAVPTPNQRIGPEAQYVLGPSQIIVDPSGSLSGTFRSGVWRNDSTRSSTEIATGWTSSGHNIGCYFYGTSIATAIAGKTIVSATIEYWRENEGGLSGGVQPLFWTHQLTTRSGTPTPNAHGVAEASRLGPAVARHTGVSPFVTSAAFSLPAAFITALQNGTARGLCMYRGYQGSGNPDNYYGLFSIGGVTGGSPSRVNGRLRFNSLG